MTAIMLESPDKLTIESDDPEFLDEDVFLRIVPIVGEEIADVKSLNVQISFTSELPQIDLSSLEITALTCSEQYQGWSINLSDVLNNVDQVLDFELIETGDYFELFTYQENSIALASDAIEAMNKQDLCKLVSHIELEFKVSNGFL